MIRKKTLSHAKISPWCREGRFISHFAAHNSVLNEILEPEILLRESYFFDFVVTFNHVSNVYNTIVPEGGSNILLVIARCLNTVPESNAFREAGKFNFQDS